MTDAADAPGERRVVCDACGWDGGTYSFTTTVAPSYCPGCGTTTDSDDVRVLTPEEEPTALGLNGEHRD